MSDGKETYESIKNNNTNTARMIKLILWLNQIHDNCEDMDTIINNLRGK